MMLIDKADKLRMLHKKMIEEIRDYAIILLDIDGTILTWNNGAEAIKGYSADEIIGQNFEVFYSPEDRQDMLPQKLIETAKQEGRAKYIGKRMRKDGSIYWASMLLTALHNDDNEVIGFTKLTREITS